MIFTDAQQAQVNQLLAAEEQWKQKLESSYVGEGHEREFLDRANAEFANIPQPYQKALHACRSAFGAKFDQSDINHRVLFINVLNLHSDPAVRKNIPVEQQDSLLKFWQISANEFNDDISRGNWWKSLGGSVAEGAGIAAAAAGAAPYVGIGLSAVKFVAEITKKQLKDFTINDFDSFAERVIDQNLETLARFKHMSPDARALVLVKAALNKHGCSQKQFNNADVEKIFKQFAQAHGLSEEQQKRLKIILEGQQKLEQKIDQELKAKLEEIGDKLDAQAKREIEAQKQAAYVQKINAAYKTFGDLENIGQSLNNKTLTDIGKIGGCAVKIGESFSQIAKDIPAINNLLANTSIFGNALSGLAMVQPYVAVASALVQIGMTLFGKKKEDPFAKAVIAGIHEILKNLQALRIEILASIDGAKKEILDAIDETSAQLRLVLKINQAELMNNVSYGIRTGEKNTNFMRSQLTNIAKNQEFRRLTELLDEAGHYRKKQREDESGKEVSLRKLRQKIEDSGLSKTLLADDMNGGNYYKHPEHRDAELATQAFVNDGMGSAAAMALGFLIPYANKNLGLNHVALENASPKLPNLVFWCSTLKRALKTRLFAAQMHDEPLNFDKALQQYQQIATNVAGALSTLKEKRTTLFEALGKKYISAYANLGDALSAKLANEIIKDKTSFTLRECLTNDWLKLADLVLKNDDGTVLAQPLGEKFVELLKNSPDALKTKIPASIVMAYKLRLIEFNLQCCDPERIPAYVQAEDKQDISRKRQSYWTEHRLYELGFKALISVKFNLFNKKNIQCSFFDINVSKPQGRRSDTWKNLLNKIHAYGEMNKENAMSDQEAFSKITTIDEISSDRDQINLEVVAQAVAKRIVDLQYKLHQEAVRDTETQLKLNKLASAWCQSAYTALDYDASAKDPAMKQLESVIGLVKAYAELMGFSEEAIMQMNGLLAVNDAVAQHPTAAKIDANIAQLKIIVAQDLSNLSGAQKLAQESLDALREFKIIADIKNGYEKQFKQFKQSVQQLNVIIKVMESMQTIHNLDSQYFSSTGFNNFILAKIRLANRLHHQYQRLLDIHRKLAGLGYQMEKPVFEVSQENLFKFESSAAGNDKREINDDEIKTMSLFDIVRFSRSPVADIKKRLASETPAAARSFMNRPDEMGRTLLHHAAKMNDLMLLKFLLSQEINFSAIDKNNKTPIDLLPVNAVLAKALLKSRKEWQDSCKHFKFNRVFGFVEDLHLALAEEKTVDEPVIFLFGRTGAGKSTLVNSMNGSVYAVKGSKQIYSAGEKEIAKRGGGTYQSTTIYPKIYRTKNGAFVDMPGFDDTGGIEADIRTGISTPLIACKTLKTQALVLVCKESEIFSDPKDISLRKYLCMMSGIIKDDPDVLFRHMILIVTHPSEEKLAKARSENKSYEQLILDELKNWYETEIQYLLYSDDQYPIKLIVEKLIKSPDQIAGIAADQSDCVSKLKNKIDAIRGVRQTSDFNFAHYHESSELFRSFVEELFKQRDASLKDSNSNVAALCSSWQSILQSRNIFAEYALSEEAELDLLFDNQVYSRADNAELHRLAQAIAQQLVIYSDNKPGAEKDDQTILERALAALRAEFVNKDFYQRLQHIASIIGINVAHSQRHEPISVSATYYKPPETYGINIGGKKEKSTDSFATKLGKFGLYPKADKPAGSTYSNAQPETPRYG